MDKGANIFLVDMLNQKLLRLALTEKDDNVPQEMYEGEVTTKALVNFTKTLIGEGRVTPLDTPKEFIRDDFECFIYQPNKAFNGSQVFLLCVPKFFNGEKIDSPFVMDMEFDYHDLA